MPDPLASFTRWAKSVTTRWPIIGDKVLTLMTLPIIGAFWAGLYLILRTFAPEAGITMWFAAKWPLVIGATVILLAAYWFVRNFFDTKTGQ